jgi:translation elongation factor EF-1alpha
MCGRAGRSASRPSTVVTGRVERGVLKVNSTVEIVDADEKPRPVVVTGIRGGGTRTRCATVSPLLDLIGSALRAITCFEIAKDHALSGRETLVQNLAVVGAAREKHVVDAEEALLRVHARHVGRHASDRRSDPRGAPAVRTSHRVNREGA